VTLKNKGKYWESLLSFDKELELCPDDEDALRRWGYILQKRYVGHLSRAVIPIFSRISGL